MSIETKKIVCEPARETNLINHYTSFGWTLSHRDEVYSQTQHITGANTYGYIFDGDFTGSGTTIHSYTTTTNYVNLLFTRETQQVHYEDLANLDGQCEKLFQELNDRENRQANSAIVASSKSSHLFLIIFLSLDALAVAFFIIGGVAQIRALIILATIFAVAGFIMFWVNIFSKKPDTVETNIMNDPTFVSAVKDARFKIANLEKQGRLLLDETKESPKESAPEIVAQSQPIEVEAKTVPTDQTARLRQLKELHEEGILTDSEYEAKRKEIVDKI
jgi:hypothetical protein